MKELNKSENDYRTSPGLPQLAGNIHKGDAALEFIKNVCGVLLIDQNVEHDVMVCTRSTESYAMLFGSHFAQQLDALDHMDKEIQC